MDKFCKDCAFYRPYQHGIVATGFSVFRVPATQEACRSPHIKPDPVDGSQKASPSAMRRPQYGAWTPEDQTCGPSAKWWQPKPPPIPEVERPRRRGLIERIFGD